MKKTLSLKKYLHAALLLLCICSLLIFPSVSAQAKTTVKMKTTSVTLSVGQSKTLKLSGTSKNPKWSSNKKAVATVDRKGKVTAVGKGTATITAKLGSKKYTCKVLVCSSSSGNERVDKEIHRIIRKIIKPSMSTVEKVKAVHDYLVLNNTYDHSISTAHPAGDISNVESLLFQHTSVCSGYAETFQLFMDALNIPCKTILGTANGITGWIDHEWNIVKLNGSWYHIDVTWDDANESTDPKLVLYRYFLVSDSYISQSHTWNQSSYPVCKTSSNSYKSIAPKVGHVAKTPKQAAQYVSQDIKKGYKYSTILIPKKSYNDDFLSNTLGYAVYTYNVKYKVSQTVSCAYYTWNNYQVLHFPKP